MGHNIPALAAVTAFWAVVGFIAPFLVRKGKNKRLIQVMLIMTAVSCWLFWFVCYMSQLNPLIGPKIPKFTVYWISKQWGDAKN